MLFAKIEILGQSSVLCIGIITNYEIPSACIFFSLSDNTNRLSQMESFFNCKWEKFQPTGLVIPTDITSSRNSGSLLESADLIPVPVRNIPVSSLLSKWLPLVISHPLVLNALLLLPNNSYFCFTRWTALCQCEQRCTNFHAQHHRCFPRNSCKNISSIVLS